MSKELIQDQIETLEAMIPNYIDNPMFVRRLEAMKAKLQERLKNE